MFNASKGHQIPWESKRGQDFGLARVDTDVSFSERGAKSMRGWPAQLR